MKLCVWSSKPPGRVIDKSPKSISTMNRLRAKMTQVAPKTSWCLYLPARLSSLSSPLGTKLSI